MPSKKTQIVQEKDKQESSAVSQKTELQNFNQSKNLDAADEKTNEQHNLRSNSKNVAPAAQNQLSYKTTDIMLGRISFVSQNNNKDQNDSTKDNQIQDSSMGSQGPIETKRSNLKTGRGMLDTERDEKKEDVQLKSKLSKMNDDRNNQYAQDIAMKKADKLQMTPKSDTKEVQIVECESAQLPPLQAPMSAFEEMRTYGSKKKSKNPSILGSFKKSYLEAAEDEAPRKNPKFDKTRQSVLERPSHYNASCINEGGEESQTPANELGTPPPPAKNADLENEKRGYMIKEQEFYKSLKDVQTYYLEICICLMQMGKFMFFLTGIYALVCMKWFGCGFGDCENFLVCSIHYIKFAQAMMTYSQYSHNITEKQPSHPIATVNAYITIFLYYICLYWYKDLLVEDENIIHFISIYLVIDTFMLLVSFFAVKKVKVQCQALINNKKYKEYSQEAEIALADVLYLPEEYESEEEEV